MSLSSKWVLYRPEHKTNGGPLKWNFEIQRWDKSTGTAQKYMKKMGLKYLKKSTSRVMVIKM